MKRKFLLIALAILLCSMFIALFAVTASADENITVTYYNRQKISGAKSEVAVPNADGTYTIKDTGFSTSGTVTLTDGAVNKEFYGWYDDEGVVYKPGEKVTFTKTTRLYEAFGVTVTTFADLKKAFSAGSYIKLGNDILDGDSAVTNSQVTSVLDLNGYDLTIDNETANGWGKTIGAFGAGRATYCFVGKGTITQLVRDKDKSCDYFARYETHGYADENNPQRMIVGRDVKIVTPYTFLSSPGSPKDGMPAIDIAGTVEAKQLFSTANTSNATCIIHETAKITLSGKEAFTFSNIANDTIIYMTLTVKGGTIIMTDAESEFLTDSLLARSSVYIIGGEFTVSAENAETMKRYIPDGLMLATESTETGVKYVVTEADCVHSWTKDEANSINATSSSTGVDCFVCSDCSATKNVITVYDPSNSEIVITVKEGEMLKEVSVKLSEVFVLEKIGMDKAAYYELVEIKGTEEYTVESIVAIQIPIGVRTIEIKSENTSLETINVIDDALVEFQSIAKLKAVKTINIGSASVHFLASSASPVLETINSYKSGATVSYASNAFQNNNTLKNITMTSDSSYTFGYMTFYGATGITELIIPDNATASIGEQAFARCTGLTYVYIGTTNKSIPKNAFSYSYAIETVVLMDVKSIGEGAFSVEGDANTTKSYREGKNGYDKPLKIFMHTTEAISINAKAFSNRAVLGVEIYMLSSVTTEFTNCTYKTFTGIAHEYYYDVVTESTCNVQGTAMYVTDCPCGVDYRTVTYIIYDSATAETTECEALGTDIVNLPLSDIHTLGTVLADIIYTNYFANGTKYYYCSVCQAVEMPEEAPSALPLFIAAGYSAEEGSGNSISYTVKVDRDAINEYTALGHDFYFGAIAALHTDGSPVVEANQAKQGAVMLDITNTNFNIISVKIVNIPVKSLNTALNCCGYAIENSDTPIIKYLCDGETCDTAKGVSYNSLVEAQPETTVSSDDEE